MATVSVLVILLAMAVGQALCAPSTIVHRRLCTRTFRRCMQTTGRVASRFYGQVDKLCERATELESCVGNCGDSMEGTFEGAAYRLIKFTCDPSRRDQVTAVATSGCFRMENLRSTAHALQNEVYGCVQRSNISRTDINSLFRLAHPRRTFPSLSVPVAEDFCPIIEQLSTCAVEALETTCGEDAAQLADQALGIVTRSLLAHKLPACFEEEEEEEEEVEEELENIVEDLLDK